jgi:hypothetical protein
MVLSNKYYTKASIRGGMMEGELDPNTMEDALCAREELQANRLKLHEYRCPCNKCHGSQVLNRTTIRAHLRKFKRDEFFTQSILVSFYLFII